MEVSKLYGYNKQKAEEGVWIECGDDGAILCRYYNPQSPRVSAVAARRTKKFRALINAKALPPEKDREIAIGIFVECAVINWRNIKVNGEEVPFTAENAEKLFHDWPEFHLDVATQAMDMKTFRDDEDVKN